MIGNGSSDCWTSTWEATAMRYRYCIAGRGVAPPEHCGGPTAYRLLLKRRCSLAEVLLHFPEPRIWTASGLNEGARPPRCRSKA
jgi:hypothetical protein